MNILVNVTVYPAIQSYSRPQIDEKSPFNKDDATATKLTTTRNYMY